MGDENPLPKTIFKGINNFLQVLTHALSFHGIFAINTIIVATLIGVGDEDNFLARVVFSNCATLVVGLVEALNIKYGANSSKISKPHQLICKFRDVLDLIFPLLALSKYLPISDKQVADIVAGAITALLAVRCLFTNQGYGVINPKIRLVAEITSTRDIEMGNFSLAKRASYHAARQSVHSLPNNKTELERLFRREIESKSFFLNPYTWVDVLLNAFKVSGITTYAFYIGTSLAETEVSLWLNSSVSLATLTGGACIGYIGARVADKLLAVCTSDFYRVPALQERIYDLIENWCSQLAAITRYFDNPINALKIMMSVFIGKMFIYTSFTSGEANGETEIPDGYIWTVCGTSGLLGLLYLYNTYSQEKQLLQQSGAEETLQYFKAQRLARQKNGSKVEEVVEVVATPEKPKELTAAQQTLPINSLASAQKNLLIIPGNSPSSSDDGASSSTSPNESPPSGSPAREASVIQIDSAHSSPERENYELKVEPSRAASSAPPESPIAADALPRKGKNPVYGRFFEPTKQLKTPLLAENSESKTKSTTFETSNSANSRHGFWHYVSHPWELFTGNSAHAARSSSQIPWSSLGDRAGNPLENVVPSTQPAQPTRWGSFWNRVSHPFSGTAPTPSTQTNPAFSR